MIQIPDKTQCSGCTACYSACPRNCISMQYDEEGFLYPHVDTTSCVDCHICEKVCPYHSQESSGRKESTLAAVQYGNETKRMESTAGGAFSLIADLLINLGAVVYAAGYDESVTVCHKRAETELEISQLRGSKYVQSFLGETFRLIKQDLRNGKTVLFVGTPCQVHGLNNLVGNHDKLYTIDLLCLGVSSPGLFRKYIAYLNEKYKARVTCVQFRNKHYGYATPNIRICFANGKYIEQKYDSRVHANLFFKHYFNARPSCYACQFREIPRCSDFTIGDFTEIGKYSQKMDDDKGTTRLWAHSEKGKVLLEMAKKNNTILVLEEDVSNIVGGPKYQIKEPEERSQFFQDAANMDYLTFVRKWEPATVKGILAGIARPIINKLPFKRFIFKQLRAIKTKSYYKRIRNLNP